MPLVPLAVGAGGRLLGSLLSGGKKPSSPAPAPTRKRLQLDAEQLRMVQLIDDIVRRVQLPRALSDRRTALRIAMLVNAYEESRLRPGAYNGAGEQSVGLFQINRQGPLGRPYTRDQLADPTNNIRVILGEAIRRADELAKAQTVGEMVELFAIHVERPADRFRRGRERKAFGRSWLGAAVMDAPAQLRTRSPLMRS